MKNKRIFSIKTLLLVPISFFLLATVALFGFMQIGILRELDAHSFNLLRDKVYSVQDILKSKSEAMQKSINFVIDEFAERYDSASCSSGIIENAMFRTFNVTGLLGFVFTDMEGNVMSSSFENIDEKPLKHTVELAVERGAGQMLTGDGAFLPGGSCQYAASVINDGLDNPLGVAIFVGNRSNNMESLRTIKEDVQAEVMIFSHETCQISTHSAEAKDLITPHEIIETCFVGKEMLYEVFDLGGGIEYYTASFPLITDQGEVNDVACIAMPRSYVDNIRLPIQRVTYISIVVMVVLVVSLLFIANTLIIKPVRKLSDEVSVIATGDLTGSIEHPERCREIIELARSVENMQEKIKDVIKPVAELSNTLVNSINTLTDASVQMSNGASRQAASLEEISSSMEEMGANIQQNTDNAIKTNGIAETIGALIGDVGTTAKKSYEAIENISENLESINELVSQTNILSLNASVEAARAGEQGKGFGVVAKEVGRLAEQTHQTASTISETASSSINEAANAYQSVAELLPKVQEVVTLVKEIATASVEQNTGVTQVNSAIIDLNRVTQESASSAERIAANTRELQSMFKQISDAVSVFKV